MKIGSKEIKVASQVKLLGVEIDKKLNFEQHINCICKSAANQLNALIRYDYWSSHERILEKSDKFSMDVKRKHKLCIKIYNKTLRNLNPKKSLN